LGQLGYGFAYRVLDAQYFGVAQRRKRVFVVGYFGDWRPAAAVLFERDSLCGNPAPSREKGKETSRVAGTLTANCGGVNRPAGNANELDFCIPTTGALCAQTGRSNSVQDAAQGHLMAIPIDSMNHIGRNSENHSLGDFVPGAPSYTLTKQHSHAVAHETSYGIPGNWIGRKPENGGNAVSPMLDLAPCQTKTDVHGVAHPIGFEANMSLQQPSTKNVFQTLTRSTHASVLEPQSMAVRRLTPVECERLQGFPDHYTDIKPKGKPTPDGPRYKALGNSWAVPVARWIGERIMQVERLKNDICKTNSKI